MRSRIEQACVDKGVKMTGQRRLIARVLSESDDHPDVAEALESYAALLRSTDRVDEAENLEARAAAIRSNLSE